ncbi:MAG: serine/threonine protein kinase [Gemmatimonadetes bacterium]|nr:serine/threonine protein kinase [Gemmatimonadota bacterium]
MHAPPEGKLMKDALNQALGPEFEIVKLLGKGRQAEVWLAREVALDRLVAVKVLLAGLADDGVARARFEREAKAAASVNHPNATSVLRFGFLPNDRPYLILPYVHGRTLEARISGDGPLPVAEARRVCCEVAGALAAAHEHGFVHRDVRPANVLCDLETGRSLLTDFGVAGILPTGKSEDPGLTGTGEFLGDISHLSPEELTGERSTEASDVYALGVLGYEILTGRGPFAHLPTSGLIAARLQAAPPRLSPLLEEHDPELEALLERCLSTDPHRRPSARFIAEALAAAPGARHGSRSAAGESEGGDLFESILRRRFPQLVVLTAGGGWLALEGVSQLVDMGVLGHMWYHLSLATVVAGVLVAAVIAWFHGAKGKQRTGPVEIALLTVIGAIWLIVSVSIILPD